MDGINEPSGETLVEIYRRATLIRRTGEQLLKIIRAGRIRAPFYSPRGQEVLSAAMSVTLNPDDYAITIYRGLHDHLAKGVPLKLLIAEYAGRATGSCGGKGGPMHITHPASGVMVTTGIVGSGMPIANGFGLASQIRGDGRVTVTNFGDGATNIGAFHEALNMASVWKLPVVFLCQNNLYGEHTAFAAATSSPDIATRGVAYSMPSIKVNGNDPVEMYRASKQAVERARSGGGPTLIEAVTFRFEGHSMGDSGKYIPPEQFAAALEKDPVPILRATLIKDGLATEAEVAAMEAKIDAEITEAIEFAIDSPFPEADQLGRDVFVEEIVP